MKSSFTLCQVATGDSWATDVVRPLAAKPDLIMDPHLVELFFCSYMILIGLVLMNVVRVPPAPHDRLSYMTIWPRLDCRI